jgi:hypothetical protein
MAFLFVHNFSVERLLGEETMTKEEIKTAIWKCAEELGHTPSMAELRKTTEISPRQIRKNFSSYGGALEACGLARRGPGYGIPDNALFLEWAMLVRRLEKLPTCAQWETKSRYSLAPLRSRYGSFRQVARSMMEYARKNGLESEWKDVMDIASAYLNGLPAPDGTFRAVSCLPPRARVLLNHPIYGPPLIPWALTYAPTNEIGVVYLFGTVARELGYAVTRMQTEFPDGEAMRQLDEGRWQRVRIEFEFESKNFLMHYHKAEDCDLIVCWRHNWAECPLEVLELKSVVGQSWNSTAKTLPLISADER